ncbi:MAG: alpha/beta hydrolase family protein [Dehalococcoidia bacterium]|nr:alpha/beta hydrolase family protein [Dehalococcoidia bacterium]
MNPYNYKSQEIKANLQLKETTSRWLHYKVDFPTAYPIYNENSSVRGEYFQPRNVSRAPLAIIIHGWGDRSAIPCHLLARTLVKKGIAAFIFYLVFHTSRMPETMTGRMPYLNTEDWFEGYRASVIEVRQIVDWAGSRPELDKERIAVLGISLGGFVSEIAMGVDKRIKAGVFMIAGGNSEIITWKTKNDAIVKGHGCTEAQCHEIRSRYPQYLAEVTEKGVDNVVPLNHCYLTDALTFAPCLRRRPVLMLNARWDKTVPTEATLSFWEACNKPDIKWLPGTHVGFWLWYPVIAREITRFLSSTFGTPEK